MRISRNDFTAFLTVYVVSYDDAAVRIIHAPNNSVSVEKYTESGRTEMDSDEKIFFAYLAYVVTGNPDPIESFK